MKAAEIDGSLAEGLGFALETVAPESLVIKPVQVRFSNYLGQHWSLTFQMPGIEEGLRPDHFRRKKFGAKPQRTKSARRKVIDLPHIGRRSRFILPQPSLLSASFQPPQ